MDHELEGSPFAISPMPNLINNPLAAAANWKMAINPMKPAPFLTLLLFFFHSAPATPIIPGHKVTRRWEGRKPNPFQ